MPNQAMPCELIRWGQVERLVHKLADAIRKQSYAPDLVVAIARGGYVPARLLCDQLDLYNLTSIRIVHYQAGAVALPGARLSMGLCTEVKARNVLLVDDVTDSGDTLDLAVQHVAARQPSTLRVAVLHHKTVSRIRPDFIGQEVRKWRWLTYPWALREDIRQFVFSRKPGIASLEEAADHLQRAYWLDLPVRTLGELLPELGNVKRTYAVP